MNVLVKIRETIVGRLCRWSGKDKYKRNTFEGGEEGTSNSLPFHPILNFP